MAGSIAHYSNISVDGVNVFYRSAGLPSNPVILLLHGFPSSSHQYRHLIPLLSMNYHVIAPDCPGFGFTEVSTARNYVYTFENLATTMTALMMALQINKFAMYIFDYGAPVGLRMALSNNFSIPAIVTQNGNAYNAGFGVPYWTPIFKYWTSGNSTDREFLRKNALTLEAFKSQYVDGVPKRLLQRIAPETWTLDYAVMENNGREDAMLDLLYDYRTNKEMYPQFQEYLRSTQVPLLAVWGRNDEAFIPPGADAFKTDLPEAEVNFLDTGHFAVETHPEEIASFMKDFLARVGWI